MSDIVSVRSIDLNPGKSLLLAILFAAVGAALIFILSRALFVNQDFVGSIYENGIPRSLAGFFLLAFPFLHQRLAGRRRTSFSHLPDGAVPIEAYTLPWYILLVYGVFIAFALAGVSILVVWLFGLATGFFITRMISITNLTILFLGFYYLGSWIGSRSVRRPYLTSIGIVVGYACLESLVSLVLGTDSFLQSPFRLGMFLGLFLLSVLIGTWIGKRKQLLSYVHFLLRQISNYDRQTAVDNLYEDVRQRISQKPERSEVMGKQEKRY